MGNSVPCPWLSLLVCLSLGSADASGVSLVALRASCGLCSWYTCWVALSLQDGVFPPCSAFCMLVCCYSQGHWFFGPPPEVSPGELVCDALGAGAGDATLLMIHPGQSTVRVICGSDVPLGPGMGWCDR